MQAQPPILPTNTNGVGAVLQQQIARVCSQAGGWLPFDRFMALALYQPRLGYYAHAGRKFGAMPASGSAM